MRKGRAPLPLPLVDALMREHTGLTVGHLRNDERLSLLTAAMREAGFSDDATYALFLRTYPSSLLDLASQLSVGETYFFRDPMQLGLLTDEVLPRLLLERPLDHVFTFWSAGCASGEEPYTLAMLLDERGLLARAPIVGTDISEVALSRARSGHYSSWSLRAGTMFGDIAGPIAESAQAAMQVAASASQQALGVSQIQQAMRDINQVTTQSLASTKQIERASHDLNVLSTRLRDLLSVEA